MSDQPSDEGDDQKWSSLIEAASQHRPIVPLPGTAPPVRPVSESPRPAPIPQPLPASPPPAKPAIPDEAGGAAAPPEPAHAVELEPPTPAVPEEPASTATPPEPAPADEPEVSLAPKPSEDAPVPAALGAATRRPRRNGNLWLLAALLLLCALIAGAGLLQAARHARRLSQAARQVATAEAAVPPAVETQAAAPAPPARQALPEAEQPVPAPEQPPPAAVAPPPNPPATAPAAVAVGRPVILYHRRASSAADRLADQLRPLARQVDVRTANAIPRRPTIRYFQPEDAAAAQALAVALRRDGGEWRVQDRTARRHRHGSGAVEVWLPDR